MIPFIHPLILIMASLVSASVLATEVDVYKSPTCGCCNKWVKHLRDNGFTVRTHDVQNVVPYKIKYGVSQPLASCHTALVNGYTIEGHVPAQDIKRLLSSEHNLRLLTVPGMPSGAPGMDTPGAPKQEFKVYAITSDDQVGIYNVHSDY